MENKHNSVIVNQIKKTLSEGGYTCVIAKDAQILTTKLRGVKPLLGWLEDGTDLSGALAADKVVGKAAAFLYVLLKVHFVYAAVISKPALEVFARYGIEVEYGRLVDAIENRTKTGFCPMEQAVWDVDEPEGVPELLKQALAKLTANKGQEKETLNQESVKQWAICQIEDKRAEIADEQTSVVDDGERVALRTQLEILNEEKKRRGYK